MKGNKNYSDNLAARRDFFQRSFPMIKIGRQRVDVVSSDILKNTCPVCGYFTLEERDAFDICGICFWEDDGVDDSEETEESGPNHMTLKEGRMIFQEAKRKLMSADYVDDNYFTSLKENFLKLDNIINQDNFDKFEILRLQNKILELLNERKVYGIEKLFDK